MHTFDSSRTDSLHEVPRVIDAVRSGFGHSRILVVGDLMLDHHVWGSVSRISPEAPVPVVRHQRQTYTAGGAGNVAANLAGLGLQVRLVALVGVDDASTKTLNVLEALGNIDLAGVIHDPNRATTTKMRVIGGHQQMLRLDSESTAPPSQEVEAQMEESIRLSLEQVDAVILSDYSKGVLTPHLCQLVINTARSKRIPVLVDPKGTDWERYRGANLITPNRSEMTAVLPSIPMGFNDFVAQADQVRERLGIDALIVTLSEEGMVHVAKNEVICVPAMAREVFDVSGAGDTSLATLTAALSVGIDTRDALVLANIAAGIVVGKVGTVPLAPGELLTELETRELDAGAGPLSFSEASKLVGTWKSKGEKIVFTNGCFDILHAGHVSYLTKARNLGHRLILGLNSDASVQRLKGPTRPINPQEQRALVLLGLAAVDAVVLFDEDSPLDLIRQLRPDVLAKGADYREEDIAGASDVRSWGGTVELVELVDGVSTTRIANRITESAN